MLIDIPMIHAFVRSEYTTSGQDKDLEECYIFAATCIPSRPPLFTAHLRSGALYSRLPLEAFTTSESILTKPTPELCPWTSIGHKAQAIKHQYLKDYDVELFKLNLKGRYLFTIDYFDGNYSEDPEQHKTHNIIELDDGRLAAMPNNFCIFNDNHFQKKDKLKPYSRQQKYWLAD